MGDLIIVFLIINPVVCYVMKCKPWVRIAVGAITWLTLYGYNSGIIGYADPHDPMTKAEAKTFLSSARVIFQCLRQVYFPV